MTQTMKWFKHALDLRNEPEVIKLLRTEGMAGYGIFISILEMLCRCSAPPKMCQEFLQDIAWELRTSTADIKRVLCDFALFTIIEDRVYNKFVLEEIERFSKVSTAKSLAGKASAEKRKRLKEQNGNAIPQSENLTEFQQMLNNNATDVEHMLENSSTDKNKIKNKNISPLSPLQGETTAKKKIDIDEFIKSQPEDWQEPLRRWFYYKLSRKEAYRSLEACNSLYQKLREISGENPRIAVECINQSIANNYAGIFALKSQKTASATCGRNQNISTW